MRPHRGVLILILGILGIMNCLPAGIVAWVMANSDLAAMERGEMDRAGEGMTKAGKILGIIGVVEAVFWTILIFVFGVTLFGVAATQGG